MKNKKVLHSIFSLLLAVITLLPFAIQFAHSLEHQHQVCDAKNVKHIHQEGIDCSDYHLKIEQNSTSFCTPSSLEIPPILKHRDKLFYVDNYATSLALKSSRAPPCFIV